MERTPEDLLALAKRCEAARKPDRALDADIYEALGYPVRRKRAALVSRRAPPGGIYQKGALWKTLGMVSGDIDTAVELLRDKAPGWSWSLQCLIGDEALPFQALVAECSGNAVMGSLALCAAMLRALAGSNAPQSPGIDPPAAGTDTLTQS